VIDGFNGLRHHSVIGCDDENDDVSDLGAARTHAGESFVTGRVDEGDLAAIGLRIRVVHLHFVCTDVLP